MECYIDFFFFFKYDDQLTVLILRISWGGQGRAGFRLFGAMVLLVTIGQDYRYSLFLPAVCIMDSAQ